MRSPRGIRVVRRYHAPVEQEGSIRFRCDAGIAGPDVRGTLGVRSFEELLDPDAQLERAERVSRGADRSTTRFPLPGTPASDGGPLTSSPQGGGTGWVVLERFHRSPWRELFRSRFTHPRSASIAERRWNLLCHLRQHGVGTPQPLAVGARGAGPVSRRSFLITRDLEDFEPAPDWLAREANPHARALGLRSIGATLSSLVTARVHLPHIRPRHFEISKPTEAHEGEACGLRAELVAAHLRRIRLPSVVLTDVEGGAIRERTSAADVRQMLAALDAPSLRISAPERRRLAVSAVRGLPRDLRASILRSLPPLRGRSR